MTTITSLTYAKQYIKEHSDLIRNDDQESWKLFYMYLQGKVGFVTNILEYAGYDPSEKIGYIPENYYAGSYNMIGIKMNDNVDYISRKAFFDCTSLRNITWGINIDSIGEECFHGCDSLVSVFIPDSVRFIGQGAFSFCTGLEFAKVSDQLQIIPPFMFFGDRALQEVHIYDCTTHIGEKVFGSCHKLYSLKYHGTTEQWEKIFKAEAWNEGSKIRKIICSDGEIIL